MSGDIHQDQDQERFEDYLELEHFIEKLQAGQTAHPPSELTPDKARIYRMAALFRSASPDEVTPRPEFAAELQTRLEQEIQQPPKIRHLPFISRKPQREPRVSRRALLAGGAAAVAASLTLGAGIEHMVEQATNGGQAPGTGQTGSAWSTPIVPRDIASTWLFVTTLAELGDNAIRFAADSLIGYVIRNDGDGGESVKDVPVIAVSAACTHMGCIVQWQDSDRKYHCPCHGGLFSEYGKPDNSTRVRYLTALPRLDTKIENDRVYVRVPGGAASKI
ncbi:MAG TPA: Rieske 2Fe-2S domain-containing protein [Ktedonobacteraceae bacterium]|nr:Rieske 2Fe-2S domain-containing protein [Ktedonobacteraceae bacterium]